MSSSVLVSFDADDTKISNVNVSIIGSEYRELSICLTMLKNGDMILDDTVIDSTNREEYAKIVMNHFLSSKEVELSVSDPNEKTLFHGTTMKESIAVWRSTIELIKKNYDIFISEIVNEIESMYQ